VSLSVEAEQPGHSQLKALDAASGGVVFSARVPPAACWQAKQRVFFVQVRYFTAPQESVADECMVHCMLHRRTTGATVPRTRSVSTSA